MKKFGSRNLATMEKHVSSTPLGISNKKRTVLRKKKKKNKKHAPKDFIFNKVFSYLFSDCHMYNPLVSSQPTFDFPPPNQISTSTGFQKDVAALPIKRRNNKLFEFLEADCYLYSPLITAGDEHVCSKNYEAIKS